MIFLTYRQSEILKILNGEEVEVYTSKYLSSLLNVSTKTIRNEMKLLKIILIDYSVTIHSLKSRGYQLVSLNEKTTNENIKGLLSIIKHRGNAYHNPMDRAHAITHLMLNSDGYILIDSLAEQFNVDRSSISRDLKYIRNCLSPYQLNIHSKPYHGLIIKGKEINKRLCLVEYTYHRQNGYKRAITLDTLFIDEVFNVIEKDGISMSKESFYHFLIHIQVLLDRYKNHNDIYFNDSEKRLLAIEYERYIAMDIAKVIGKYFHIKLNENEIYYITIHIIGKKKNTTSEVDSCINSVILPEIQDVILKGLRFIYEKYEINLLSDEYLNRSLGLHYLSMVNRFYYDIYRRNPMKEVVKENYFLAYVLAKEFINKMHLTNSSYIDEDEISFLALHFQLALDRLTIHPLRIVLVSDFVTSVLDLLKYHINARFSEKVIIVEVLSLQEYHLCLLEEIDYYLIVNELSKKVKKRRGKVIEMPAFVNMEILDELSTLFGMKQDYPMELKNEKDISINVQDKEDFYRCMDIDIMFDNVVVKNKFAILIALGEEGKIIQYHFSKSIMWDSYYVTKVILLYSSIPKLSESIAFLQDTIRSCH